MAVRSHRLEVRGGRADRGGTRALRTRQVARHGSLRAPARVASVSCTQLLNDDAELDDREQQERQDRKHESELGNRLAVLILE